ncbi:MAG: GNAT family N-acetyltransferase [Candidatus Riflebacteria bacterium]|nr:GNAT family N-acetyltransferase [Candidatus Riflebacteria bacterium]
MELTVAEEREIPRELADDLSPPERVGIKRFFLRAFMDGELHGISTSLLVARDRSGAPLAASAVSRLRLAMDCIAPSSIQRLAGAVRRLWPSFLELDLLMCGIPASLADNESVVVPGLSVDVGTAVRRALIAFSADLMEREQRMACVWKEFDRAALKVWQPAFEQTGFAWFPSVPVSVQTVRWTSLEDYLQRLRAPYRRQLAQNVSRAAASGVEIELDLDPGPHMAAFARLYQQVLARSSTRLETLSVRFFELLAEDPRVRFIRASMAGRTVGGALCYVDAPSVLVFLYVGMDYAVMRETDLYFNLLRAIVELAAARRVSRVHWGQTSPDAKGRMGATLEPLRFALLFRKPLIQRLLRHSGGWLFPEHHQIARRVFKGDGS